MVDTGVRVNDKDELNPSFPERCIFAVERNAIGGLRVLSTIKQNLRCSEEKGKEVYRSL